MSDNKNRLSKLYKDLDSVMTKREELQAELNAMTTMAVKLQGAIEVLEDMENESKQKKEKKSD
jgi:prefoldin subunit 5